MMREGTDESLALRASIMYRIEAEVKLGDESWSPRDFEWFIPYISEVRSGEMRAVSVAW